jgi:hypothetical protein
MTKHKYPRLAIRVSQETKEWLIKEKKKHITWENFLNILKETYEEHNRQSVSKMQPRDERKLAQRDNV